MAKVSGSYASVIQGVSQQVPQDRRPGQHYDQVNMISDPVRGLSRRQGSVMEAETLVSARNTAFDAATLTDTQDYKELTFFVGPVEYSLLYRTKPRPANSQAPALICYNKDTNQFVTVSETAGTLLTTLKNNGVSAVVNVGRYLYFAPNNHVSTYTTTPAWSSQGNSQWGVVWVRTGAYGRTYRITMRTNLGTIEVTYTTPTSSYPGVLDTSDIAASDPDYNKKVTDRQSAYQTAVTQWIGTASNAIQPQNIADQLRVALANAANAAWGWPLASIGRTDSHVVVWAAGTDTIVDIIVDDGGNGDGAWAVGNEVPEVAKLSAKHFVGKVVRIRPKKADQEDAYYMKALPRITGQTGWAEVTWVETAGQVATPAPDNTLVFATVEAGVFRIASSAAALGAATGLAVPGFSSRAVGDNVTSPVPFLFGKQITYMGLIQDRMIIAAGSVLFLSRPGDYLNWWRKSVLSVDEADPIEMFALGAEDDVITAGVSYDRSIVLFGRRKQYIINGRQNITPQNASVVVMSSYEDATEADPQPNGNFVFYGKSRNGFTSLHQIQTGLVAEAPETYEVSKQLDTYIEGRPVQILPVMAPNTLFIRTTGDRQTIYVYTYMDSPDGGQRLFDSWSKWRWNPILGHTVGMTYTGGDILIFTLRAATTAAGVDSWFVCADRFTLTTELSERPYVDSARPWSTYMLGNGTLRPGWAPGVAESSVAIGRNSTRQFMGVPANLANDFATTFPSEVSHMWVGADYADLSYVIPTNPYIRDRNEKAIINGRLTINRYSTYLADSGGMIATVTTPGRGEYQVLDWTGRTVGRPSSEIGIQPISTGAVPVPVGRETREFTYKLRAKKWLPFTLTAIEWVGQLFYNQRRV
jgi:hypothetical protein